jgi:hypothetical protein
MALEIAGHGLMLGWFRSITANFENCSKVPSGLNLTVSRTKLNGKLCCTFFSTVPFSFHLPYLVCHRRTMGSTTCIVYRTAKSAFRNYSNTDGIFFRKENILKISLSINAYSCDTDGSHGGGED